MKMGMGQSWGDACFLDHPVFGPIHVFWTWPDFFCTWGHKKCGGRACVFSGPCGDISFGTACACAGPRECFLDSQITVYNCF